jgi:hypothetical protein
MVCRRERVKRTLTAVEAGVEKERACDVDPLVVREAVSAAPMLTWWWLRRQSALTQRWSGR